MKSFFQKLFFQHWDRKILSIILAIIVWFVINKTLTITKTIPNVPIKIVNIPPGKTVEGIQTHDILVKRIDLTITGKKTLLDELHSNDIEIVLDATNKEGEWIATITKNNLRARNPEIALSQGVSYVAKQNIVVKLKKLVTDKIPIRIAKPIGEGPNGYHYLDIWPDQLYITVSGPEDVVKKLKTSGVQLIFNLNDISKAQLDELKRTSSQKNQDVVSFYVPNHWKQISLPLLSSTPIEINDPNAPFLRIDFFRSELLKLDIPIPITIFIPFHKIEDMHFKTIHLAPHPFIETHKGINIFTLPLYVKGVSSLFLEIVKNWIEMVIYPPKTPKRCFNWSIQFVDYKRLEDHYVHVLMSDPLTGEEQSLQPQIYEEYLRSRFRNYMDLFKLFKSETESLDLCPIQQGYTIILREKDAE